MRNNLRRWFPLYLVLALCAVCLTAWAFLIPIFESPDEPHHWAYTQYVHSHLALPPYDPQYIEGNQAPFYYSLMAPLAFVSDSPPSLARLEEGKLVLTCPPHFFQNCKSDFRKYFPIRIVRLATAALSLAGVLFTALAVLELTGSVASAVIAAALIGFLPQFDFRGATVDNDAAAASMSAVATYFILRLAVRGYERVPALLGAVATALAFLSKINAVVIVPVFAACLLLSAGDWRSRLRRLSVLGISAAIALPWLIHNKRAYGDILASDVMLRTIPSLVGKRSITDPYFYTTFPETTWRSLIGYFGWMNVTLPEPIYRSYAILLGFAALGLLFVAFYQRKQGRLILLLAAIPLMSIAVMVYLNLTFPQPQGRLLFPCLSALAILVAIGLGAVRAARPTVAAGVLIYAAGVNVYALDKVIYPAYWSDKRVAEVPDIVVPGTLMKGTPPGPLNPGHSFTQSFVAKHDGLSRVDVEVGGYGQSKEGVLRLSLLERAGGPAIGTTKIPATAIPACCIYAKLSFAPLPHSGGKQYSIFLSSEGFSLPHGVTVFLSGSDVYPDGEFDIDGKSTDQDTSFRTYYTPEGQGCPSCQ